MADETSSESKSPANLTYDMLRVTPSPPERDVNSKTDRLTDFLIILFILGISIWFRFLVLAVFNESYDYFQRFDIIIKEDDPFGFGRFLGVTPGTRIYTEGYYDFDSYYVPYVNAFEEGWNPYTGSREPDDSIGGYVYGPFYILSIAVGRLWFGMDTVSSIVFSNVIIDSLTYAMVYVLAKRVTGNVIAMIFALAGSFSPISLYYIAARGLNAPIMNLSFLLFIWCYLEKRDNLSMVLLAFSLLTKQFPLFMAMPIGLWMVRRYGFFKGVAYYLKGIIATLVLSVPYILWTPQAYVIRLFLPGGSKTQPDCPRGGEATNLFHGLVPVEHCFNENGRVQSLDTTLLPDGWEFWFSLVNSHVLFFGFLILLAYVAFTGFDYLEEEPRLYLVFFAAYYSIGHATIARGIFKYYLTFLMPLLVLGFIVGNRGKSLHLRLGTLLHNGWKTWFHPRYRQKEATPQFWLFGITLAGLTFGVIWMISSAVNLIAFGTDKQLLWNIIFIPIGIFTIVRPSPRQDDYDSPELETVDEGQYATQLSVYLGLSVVLSIFLNSIAQFYFSDGKRVLINFITFFLILLGFVVLPYLKNWVTGESKLMTPFTFHPKQTLTDLLGIVISFAILITFQVQSFLVHRYDITLFLFVFSFIPMAMLRHEVWKSGLNVPVRFLEHVFRIRNYVNPPIIHSEL